MIWKVENKMKKQVSKKTFDMFMKKSIATTLAFAAVQINTVFAQINEIQCTPVVNGKNIICNVKIPEIKGNGALLMIIAKGDTDIQPSDVYAIELITQNDPEPITFVMPDNASGDENQQYSVVIRNGTDAEESFDFCYVNPEIASQIIVGLKAAEKENIDTFMSGTTQGVLNTAGLASMGVHTDVYGGITANKGTVWDIYYSKSDSFQEMSDYEIVEWLNNGIICGALNEEGADFSELLYKLNLSFEDAEYANMADSQKQWINQYVSANLPIGLENTIENVFESANILYSFNNARYSDIDTLIANYGDKVGINASSYYATYQNFKHEKKTLTQEKMVVDLGKTPVNNISELTPVFETAVQSAKVSGNSGSSGGSGGSGGSSGSGSSANFGMSDKSGVAINSTADILESSKPFNDLSSVKWAEEAIIELNERNVISGMGDGSFCPQESVTREQMVKMILLASGFSASYGDVNFKDVDPDKWYAPYVESAVKQGIAVGIDDMNFGVGRNITRQDASVMIDRAMKLINKSKDKVRQYTEFADQSEIAEYAVESIENLYTAGVINGKENQTFDPKATCTRAEAAKMIYDALVK